MPLGSVDMRDGMVFIFGAGASKAEKAPTTDELLFRSLSEIRSDNRVENVKDFLSTFFYVDTEHLERSKIPTFEETLTMIDISLARQEDFSRNWNCTTLAETRDNLIYCIAKILDQTLTEGGALHKSFVTNLFSSTERTCKNTSFINLNYDILLDNALIDLYASKDWDLDYEIEFRNFVEPVPRSSEERALITSMPGDWHRPRKDCSLFLLKPHGSLNWLYCPNCNSVKTTKKEKGVLRIWTQYEVCEKDRSIQKPLIVPPTWEKVYDNPHLTRIWLRASDVLRKASKVFFIGYSLPDSDTKLKYLFKRTLYEVNPPSRPSITVILKQDEQNEKTKDRYKRLFGQAVNFSTAGFEDFATKVGECV
jgi:hypothetical protein